jgi:hypothetical protein
MKDQLIVVDYTEQNKPIAYLAVECDDDNIYEVPLHVLIEYHFISDGNLEQYYIKNHDNYIDLYKDLKTIGYDIGVAITELLNDPIAIQYIPPIPKGIYPIVLKYYKGEADDIDLDILETALQLGLIPLPGKSKNRGYGGSSN